MSNAHTPGTWYARKEFDGAMVSIEETGKTIVSIPEHAHTMADARLIAAAPAMLDALRKVQDDPGIPSLTLDTLEAISIALEGIDGR